jgi:replication factor C subunit 1
VCPFDCVESDQHLRKVAKDATESFRELLAELWVDKYKPKELAELCGNKSGVEKLRAWLKNW